MHPHSIRTLADQLLMLSSVPNIFLGIDPYLLSLGTYRYWRSQVASSILWNVCQYHRQYDCVKDLGYDAPVSGQLYEYWNLPIGNGTVSNTPGEVTSPVSWATFTWSAAGTNWTF
jgi:hypothetical protein